MENRAAISPAKERHTWDERADILIIFYFLKENVYFSLSLATTNLKNYVVELKLLFMIKSPSITLYLTIQTAPGKDKNTVERS